MIRSFAPLLLIAGAAACGNVNASRAAGDAGDPAPAEVRGLRISMEATPRAIAPGEPAELMAVLTNRSDDTVRIRFEDSCQLLVYVEDEGGVRVVPYDGEWICLQVETSLVLAPGAAVRRPLSWTGRRRLYDDASAALPPGEYTAYATLDGNLQGETISLRSEPTTLSVRP